MAKIVQNLSCIYDQIPLEAEFETAEELLSIDWVKKVSIHSNGKFCKLNPEELPLLVNHKDLSKKKDGDLLIWVTHPYTSWEPIGWVTQGSIDSLPLESVHVKVKTTKSGILHDSDLTDEQMDSLYDQTVALILPDILKEIEEHIESEKESEGLDRIHPV